ncbi:hypothetical protein SRABI84_03643 [Peribacillus simplex]|nr:hypothetical protein SRABI84_03643 [Peribacillus simplex]
MKTIFLCQFFRIRDFKLEYYVKIKASRAVFRVLMVRVMGEMIIFVNSPMIH